MAEFRYKLSVNEYMMIREKSTDWVVDGVVMANTSTSLVERAMLAEIERLREIIGTTPDGVLIPDAEHLFCPKCGNEVRVNIDIAYCDNCPNPDDGCSPNHPPLPLFLESCYASPEAAKAA